ncbi:MAG: GNAT family N-acetyltransferase [Acidocella sp.]|nr:GNAT family N-acetyltransferase [Acidocella sp.]
MIRLRAALPGDVGIIHNFIRRLAAYEREPDAVKMSVPALHEALFGEKPRAEALLAEDNGAAVGFAVWLETFNTWTGSPAMHLEDLFVDEAARGRGVGAAIISHLAKLAMARGCQRLEWMVLDWNEPAINFYRRQGAAPLADWTKFRLSGAALAEAAQREDLSYDG